MDQNNLTVLCQRLKLKNCECKESKDRGDHHKNYIVKEMWTLWSIMRILGTCPVSFAVNHKKIKDNISVLYTSVEYFSWVTFYSVFISTFRIYVCFIHFEHWGFSVLGRSYQNTVEDWLVRKNGVLFPVSQIWDVLCGWITSKKLSKVLISWSVFENEYLNTFQLSTYHSKLHKWILFFISAAAISALGVGFVSSAAHAILKPLFYRKFFSFISGPFFLFLSSMEEVKVIVAYLALYEGFAKVRIGIQNTIKHQRNGLSSIQLSQVLKWSRLLKLLKQQVKMIGIQLGPQQSLSLSHSVLSITECFFVAAKVFIVQVSPLSSYTAMSIVFVLVHAGRVLLKMRIAEQMTREENMIAQNISTIESENIDIQFEVNKIIGGIYKQPTKISLPGSIFLETRLIGKMSSYIMAYLVVLLQFQFILNRNGSENILETGGLRCTMATSVVQNLNNSCFDKDYDCSNC